MHSVDGTYRFLFYVKRTESLNVRATGKFFSSTKCKSKSRWLKFHRRIAEIRRKHVVTMLATNYKTIYSLKLQQRGGWFLLRHYGHSFRSLLFIKCHPDELISQVFQCLHLSVTHRSFTFELKEKQAKRNAYNSLDSFWLDFESGRRRASHTFSTASAHWGAKYHAIAASYTE